MFIFDITNIRYCVILEFVLFNKMATFYLKRVGIQDEPWRNNTGRLMNISQMFSHHLGLLGPFRNMGIQVLLEAVHGAGCGRLQNIGPN